MRGFFVRTRCKHGKYVTTNQRFHFLVWNDYSNMREEAFYQRAALVWRTVWDTPAKMSIVKSMMRLDPAMDSAEAVKSKMKVNRLARKVDLNKLFKKARADNNNKVPWRVATVWLSLRDTPADKSSIVDIWTVLDPLMLKENASRSEKKVKRLGEGLDFHKIWEIATCVEDCIMDSNSDKGVSDSNNPSKKNDTKESNSSDDSSSKNSNTDVASDSINPSKNGNELFNLRDADFFQRAALIWRALQGTCAALSLTDTMLWLDPAMDRAEADNNRMKVSRLAKKVDLDKVFEKSRSNNGKAPWRVATIWLSLQDTSARESSMVNIWKMLDPSMLQEEEEKNRKKVSRLVQLGPGLNFGQLWKTALTNGFPSAIPQKPSKRNDASEEDINWWASDSESNCNEESLSSDDPSDSNSRQLIVDKETLFIRAAEIWNSLRDTPGEVSLTKAIKMMFPHMTLAEAKQSKAKVARLAKRSIDNASTAASQTSNAARTQSTSLLTTLSSGPALGNGKPRAASRPMAADPNKSDEVDKAPPTLPILQVSIPSSIKSVSTLGAPFVDSTLSTSSSLSFPFSVQEDGDLTPTSSSSSCQSFLSNGHRYSHASSYYGMEIGAAPAPRSRAEGNVLKEEGFVLVRKTVKQKQAERHNRSLEETRSGTKPFQDHYKAIFKLATTEYFEALRMNKKTASAKMICNDIATRPGMMLINERSVRRAVAKGEVGLTPKKAGRPSSISERIFTVLCGVCLSYVQISQINGVKTADRQELIAKLNVCVQLKEGYDTRKGQELWDRVVKKIAYDLDVIDESNFVEARRVEWTTFLNFDMWFEAWKTMLLFLQFGRLPEDEPDPNFEDEPEDIQEGEVIFFEGQRARILNLDESRVDLDGSEGNAGGRPVTNYFDRTLPNAGTASSKTSDACTIIAGSNAAWEPLPAHFQLPSKAKRDNYRFNLAILDNMRTVNVRFGHSVNVKLPPTFGYNEKGGMDNIEFSRYLLDLTSRLYPDRADVPGRRVIVKVDSGPGRNCEELKALLRTEGVYLIMGVPNGTATGQETDQQSNYGTFKPSIRRNRNRLFSYRQSKFHTELAVQQRKKVAAIETELALCERKKAAAIETELALRERKVAAIEIDDGEAVIEINSDDDNIEDEEENKEEETRADILVYPFAADQEKIEYAAQSLIEAIAEAPLVGIEQQSNSPSTLNGANGAFVNFCSSDIERLNPQRWLNDTVVDFWMMWYVIFVLWLLPPLPPSCALMVLLAKGYRGMPVCQTWKYIYFQPTFLASLWMGEDLKPWRIGHARGAWMFLQNAWSSYQLLRTCIGHSVYFLIQGK
jgi:hypothetical protein